jgi:exopolysaccharide biosynthesis polyprenyl glycosylphosphotransferase
VIRVAVIGRRRDAARLIDHPVYGESDTCHLAAFIDPGRHRGDVGRAMAELIRDQRIDTILLAGRLDTPLFRLAIDVACAAGCQVVALPRIEPSSSLLPTLHWRNGYPVVELTHPAWTGVKMVTKRAIDLIGSSVALLVLAPLLGLIALAIRLTSPGPILFRQTRIGRGGKEFTILKFRTMVPNAEAQRAELQSQSVYRDGRLFKLEHDPRVTRLGAVLRRTSLDELPQLWNVIRGEMSLVGPRPPIPSEVELYRAHHYARFDVKPGVTGPWQVSGRNTIRDFDRVVRLETDYIRRWTIGLDLALLARTVPAVLSRRGAH